MAIALKTIPVQGGGWFKPKENRDAVAVLIEVNQFDLQRPTPNGPKDSALCDVTVFKSAETLAAGTPEVAKGQRIEQTVLARDLKDMVGAAVIVTLDQIPPSKPGQQPAWVWRTVHDAAIVQQVVDYANKRDEAAEAAIADAPDFD
ncbi:hypothetical protein [Streptomyces sp. NBC_01198]|uniref:hypothetical protein n=1 Tax=Streptomyces sp. NBC_01198 TaxID=2903769 RepID=UPI002E144094|nr:hypothetical protein OG702_31935 [Streptomyces sp. NBC_01198]